MRRKSTPNLSVPPSPKESVWEEAQITYDGEDLTKKLKRLEHALEKPAEDGEPGRKRGKKSTKDWDLITAFLLGQISRTEPNRLDNLFQLKNDVADFLQNKINYVPPDERLAAKIRAILQRVGF